MKRITVSIFIVMAVCFLGVSCSNPAGSSSDYRGGTDITEKKVCKITFNNNVKEVSMNWGCSETSPASISVKEGEEVTVPSFSGVLQEYENNEIVRTYSFISWNTDKNGEGTEYKAGSNLKILKNMVLYAQYDKNGKPVSDKGNSEEEVLDFGIKTSYSLKMGEKVKLSSSINGYDVFYQVQNGSDAVSVSGNEVKAETVGEAVVTAEAWNDSSRKWYCTISVTAEGFSGSGTDYKLIGKWVYENGSYIVFNTDKSGEMKVYLNGSVVQDTAFTWYSFKNSYGEFFVVENSSSNVNGQYTILRLDVSSLRFKGRLAFGLPQETEWSKE